MNVLLYKKNSMEFDPDLFKNPTSEYRGAPFWSWNCKLDEKMLLKQIEYLKEMGFGGFHMHSRHGMNTEYLSDEFMKMIRVCVEKAKQEGMLAWLYDEDKWPSGFAGGYVTKNPVYRRKYLVLSEKPVPFVSKEEGIEKGLPYLVTCFDIFLNADGTLKSYRQIGEDEEAAGVKRYAYVITDENEMMVDIYSAEAIRSFIQITHERYKEVVGDEFDKTIPAIFTDEPNFDRMLPLKTSDTHADMVLSWTVDFAETYRQAYGEDLIAKIPELVWELADGRVSVARYHFHDHRCERFTTAFVDQIGAWCDKNGIALTGHMLAEETLYAQTVTLGEAMRAYRSMAIPGMDLLCNTLEPATAKQAQSSVHQYGREAMISELYGVTNWDFDFRGHKYQGDWQAALGVTIRTPHLSWMTMKGAAKRDFPASIHYQSPWYNAYSYVEDHFARLNTVLTLGKPVVRVGMLHPIESYWLHYGPVASTAAVRERQDSRFQNAIEWLLTGMVDFDFISESQLPMQCGEVSDILQVGQMAYSTVIVPGCETIRRSTFDILNRFVENGGKLIFMGDCPTLIDALPTDEVRSLYDRSIQVDFDKEAVLNALREERTAEIITPEGLPVTSLIHTFREDGDSRWLFLAHLHMTQKPDVPTSEQVRIILPNEYTVSLYDTLDGTVKPIEYETRSGKTYIDKELYSQDTLLLRLTKGQGAYHEANVPKQLLQTIYFKEKVAFEREEKNVYLMDMAAFSLDGGKQHAPEEMRRIDAFCRDFVGEELTDSGLQPWRLPEETIEHFVELTFTVFSKAQINQVWIAGEEAEEIRLNGRPLTLTPTGYYVDESIHVFEAGMLCEGENIITVKAPIGKRTTLENYYLLGDFDVAVNGCDKVIMSPSRAIHFGDITRQGMPFYGGNLVYKTEIETPDCDVSVCVSRYRGALVQVFLDDKEAKIVYEPYKAVFRNVAAGKHTLVCKVFGNRINTFGGLHNCGYTNWFGGNIWYTKGAEWSYEYVLKETGILSSPVIELTESKDI